MSNTRKRMKFIGNQTYINRDSGEIVEMKVTEIEERDANFHKLWLGHLIQSLDILGTQKIKVLNHIMGNINKENQFIGTQRAMAKELNMSTKTINVTIKILIDNDFMKKVTPSVYQINPNILFKGGTQSRLNILIRYNNLGNDEKEGENDNE